MTTNTAQLNEIALGKSQRNIMSTSMKEYLGRMRTLTRLLNENEELRLLTLELDENGNAKEHVGNAKGVLRMKFPMQVEHARLLFAMISVDSSLARRGRNRIRCEEEEEEEGVMGEGAEVEEECEDEIEVTDGGGTRSNVTEGLVPKPAHHS